MTFAVPRIALALAVATALVACAPQPVAGAGAGWPDCDARSQAGPFDRGCAAKTLAHVSDEALACAGFPDDTIHVKVVFAPTGHARLTKVDTPSLAGTPVAACIEARFMEAEMPPFKGTDVSVGKTVSRR